MEKNFLLMSINWKKGEEPSLKDLSQDLNIDKKDFDIDFGIVKVDDDLNIYAFRIEENAWYAINKIDKNTKGPFSDIKIEPFDLNS
jgi:hypothetical protein